MKHKWEYYTINKKTGKKVKGVEVLTYNDEIVTLYDCKECINCGLKKGTSKAGRLYYTVVYFKDKEILSLHKLPYKCLHDNDFLFSEGDFYIDV